MNLKRVIISAALVVATGFGVMQWKQLDREIARYECDTKPITVLEGDTLWGLTREHCWGNLSRALDDAVERFGTNLPVGLQVVLGK